MICMIDKTAMATQAKFMTVTANMFTEDVTKQAP